MLYDDTVVLLFAKAPVSGTVNTRLIPYIGEQAATQLQQELIHHRLNMLAEADLCAVELCCTPDVHHACFLQCQHQYPIHLRKQYGEDLGLRMFNAAREGLKRYRHCIIIGTDAPALKKDQLQQAIGALHSNVDVVVVPAEDGGYVLLGLSKAYRFLFDCMPWGSDDVIQQTRHRLITNQVSFEFLETCWDVDRLDDYHRYLQYIS